MYLQDPETLTLPGQSSHAFYLHSWRLLSTQCIVHLCSLSLCTCPSGYAKAYSGYVTLYNFVKISKQTLPSDAA